MPSDNANREDPPPPVAERTALPEAEEGPLEGTLTEEDIREIEASGITLGDVIQQIKAQYGV